jgi:hypothetical protein
MSTSLRWATLLQRCDVDYEAVAHVALTNGEDPRSRPWNSAIIITTKSASASWHFGKAGHKGCRTHGDARATPNLSRQPNTRRIGSLTDRSFALPRCMYQNPFATILAPSSNLPVTNSLPLQRSGRRTLMGSRQWPSFPRLRLDRGHDVPKRWKDGHLHGECTPTA